MPKINFVSKASDPKWTLIAKLWRSKDGATLAGNIGIKSKDNDGNLIDRFDKVELTTDDVLFIRENTRKREGMKDPDYLVYVAEGEKKDETEA
jgi:hypothetical protein